MMEANINTQNVGAKEAVIIWNDYISRCTV